MIICLSSRPSLLLPTLAVIASLLPWSGAFLAAGVLFQIVPLLFQRFAKTVRLTVWCVGLLGWFGGGVVSFGHAFS